MLEFPGIFVFWALKNTGICRTMFKIAEIFGCDASKNAGIPKKCLRVGQLVMLKFPRCLVSGALKHTGFSRMSGFLS